MTPPPASVPSPIVGPSAARTAYLVLGMHRSGTSAATQLLALAGAELPANVMPGDEHNEKGYFEPWKIAMFNDRRLRAGGGAWDDVFGFPHRPLPAADESGWRDEGGALFDQEYAGARLPLMKDPRVTVLLPFWREILGQRRIAARCVIPVRHPLAVAASLGRRNGFSVEKSVLLWSAYMLAAEAYTRDLPRAFIGYDALLTDWRAQAARIEAGHAAALPGLDAKAGEAIDRFLTPDLRHNETDDSLARAGDAGAVAQDVFDWFAAAADDAEPDAALLTRARARLDKMRLAMGPLVSATTRDLDAARSELIELRQNHAYLQSLYEALREERSAAEATLDALLSD